MLVFVISALLAHLELPSQHSSHPGQAQGVPQGEEGGGDEGASYS